MKLKRAIPSMLLFSFEKRRFGMTSFVLFFLLLFAKELMNTKWIFIHYCVSFSVLYLVGSVYARSYFDEIHSRNKTIFQTIVSSKSMLLHLSLYLLLFIMTGCCLMGFGNLMQVVSKAPWIGSVVQPLTLSLFFLSKFLEVVLSVFFLVFLFILAPLAAFRLDELKRWPQYILDRLFKQNQRLLQGFLFGSAPLCILSLFISLTTWKMQVSFFNLPILLVSSFMLAPFVNFYFAASCFFHLHFAYLVEQKGAK